MPRCVYALGLEYDLASVAPPLHVTVGLGGLSQRESHVHVHLQLATRRQASQFLKISSGIVTQPFYEVEELKAVDRDVLGVEVARIDLARLQRNVRQGHHPPAVPDCL